MPLLRLLSLFVAVVLLVCAVFAPVLAPNDPEDLVGIIEVGPFEARDHPLGTDNLGRDVLSRLIYGARNAVAVVISTVVLSAAMGAILGALAGFGGRIGDMIDRLLVRPTAEVAGLPTWCRVLLSATLGMHLGLTLFATFGPGFINVVLILALLCTPRVALAVRNAVRGIRCVGVDETGDESSAVNPRSRMRANIAITLLIVVVLQSKSALLLESSFTFLGLGILPNMPAWGGMVARPLSDAISLGWLLWFPLASIITTATALHFLGGWVREGLSPKVVLAALPVGGAAPTRKNRGVAGLLAIFLGCFGVHKFYLGNVKMGAVYLLCSTLGYFLIVPPLVILVVSIVEGVRYLMTDDGGFQRRYVDPQRAQDTSIEWGP